jgi:hypothetical protein
MRSSIQTSLVIARDIKLVAEADSRKERVGIFHEFGEFPLVAFRNEIPTHNQDIAIG